MPPSIDNLKKHFQMVVDRLEKGGRVSTTLPATPSGPPVAVSTVSNKAPINGMTGTTSPAGSKKVKGAKRQSN